MSNTLEQAIAEYKQLDNFQLYDSGKEHLVAGLHTELMCKEFGVKFDAGTSSYYDMWLYDSKEMPLDIFIILNRICSYEREVRTKHLPPGQILHTIFINSKYMDIPSSVSSLDEIVEVVNLALSCINNTRPNKLLCTINLVNAYLVRLGYPTVAGENIIRDGLNINSLENDLTASIWFWCHGLDDKT